MADTKISQLTTLSSSTVASGDWIPVVDASDTSMAATGTTKKVDAGNVAITDKNNTFSGFNTFSSTLTASAYRSGDVSVNNNAATILSGVAGRGILILLNGNRNGESGMIAFRAQASPYCTLLTPDGSTLIQTSTSILTGTTGTNGYITVSATSGGEVYVENRSGTNLSSIRYVVLL